MSTKLLNRRVSDSYFDLVKRFPLTHIRDDTHLDEASEFLDELLRKDLDEGEREYLEVLSDLVEAYEEEYHPIPDASEADVLRLLMESHGLSQQKLAKAVGIAQSTISAVLNESRTLTKDHILKLAKYFNVSPAAFMPA